MTIAQDDEAARTKMVLQRIRYQNMTDAVYASLSEAIFSRRFALGQRINVDELRQQLGVSRTPLKDALNRLATEGLIRVVPHRGTFVSELRADEMAEISDVRRVLKLYAVEQGIPRITPQQLQRMKDPAAGIKNLVTPHGTCADQSWRSTRPSWLGICKKPWRRNIAWRRYALSSRWVVSRW